MLIVPGHEDFLVRSRWPFSVCLQHCCTLGVLISRRVAYFVRHLSYWSAMIYVVEGGL